MDNTNMYSTPEQIAKLAEPDPEFAEFLATTPQPTIELSFPVVQALRQHSLAIEQQQTASALAAGRLEESRTIPMRDGYESEIRIHRPKTPRTPSEGCAPENGRGSPLVVLIFGGGFFMGNCLQMGNTARALTDLYGATVVCISYRLAPEHPWPQAHYDGWDNLVWIAANASSLGADTAAGFVLGGSSAGGNIAAVLAQKSLKEKFAAPLTGLWMDVSMVFAKPENCPEKYRHLYISYAQNEDAPGLLTKQAIQYIKSASKADGFSPDFSPVNAETPHVGMPRTFIQAAGMDMYRDDTVIYWTMLREHGVEARLKVYPGVPHGHANLYPQLKASREARVDTLEGFGWLVGGEVGRERISQTILEIGAQGKPGKHEGVGGK